MASRMQVPEQQGKNAFMERKRNLGRATENKQSMAFHWLSPGRERRGSFLLLQGSSVLAGHESAPFWSPDSIQLRFRC